MTDEEISTHTHEGVKLMIGKEFVLTGKLPNDLGKFYTKIYNRRLSGDYEDFFNNTKEIVEEYKPQAELFINTVESLINN